MARAAGRPSGPPARSRGPGTATRPRPAGTLQAAATVVSELIAGPLASAGFDVEDVTVTRAGTRHVVAVAVDRDGGLDLDAVADASRLVSEVLDGPDAALPAVLRDAYTLEVSSRGATAPLTAPRHWRRAVRRLVVVDRDGAASVTGRLTGSDDEGADLDTDDGPVRVAFADVTRAVVQLEFRPPDDADPGGDAPEDEL